MGEAPRPVRTLVRLVARAAWRAADALAELAISPAQAGTTGWFFKGARRIDPPKTVMDETAQAELWRRTAELVEMEIGGFTYAPRARIRFRRPARAFGLGAPRAPRAVFSN